MNKNKKVFYRRESQKFPSRFVDASMLIVEKKKLNENVKMQVNNLLRVCEREKKRKVGRGNFHERIFQGKTTFQDAGEAFYGMK